MPRKELVVPVVVFFVLVLAFFYTTKQAFETRDPEPARATTTTTTTTTLPGSIDWYSTEVIEVDGYTARCIRVANGGLSCQWTEGGER